MDRLYIPVIILHLSIVEKNPLYCNDNTITELELLIAKTPLLHMLYYVNWLTYEFWTRKGDGSLIAPMAQAHPLHPIDKRSRNRRRNTWVGWYVSSWWSLCPSRSSVYICILYMSYVIGRMYTYNRNVIQYWWSCTSSHPIGLYFWGMCGSWVECQFLFSLVNQLCLALW